MPGKSHQKRYKQKAKQTRKTYSTSAGAERRRLHRSDKLPDRRPFGWLEETVLRWKPKNQTPYKRRKATDQGLLAPEPQVATRRTQQPGETSVQSTLESARRRGREYATA